MGIPSRRDGLRAGEDPYPEKRHAVGPVRAEKKKAARIQAAFSVVGWETGSRTPIIWFRARCPTIERSPTKEDKFYTDSAPNLSSAVFVPAPEAVRRSPARNPVSDRPFRP